MKNKSRPDDLCGNCGHALKEHGICEHGTPDEITCWCTPFVRKSAIPRGAICLFRDGDQWCAVFDSFVNLQESPAAFGATTEEALRNLAMLRLEPTK